MSGDLEQFLADVAEESKAAGKVADLQSYLRHFEVARQVSELRRAKGWSQTELAKASGVQQSEISRIERGQGNPTFQTMSQLAGAFGMHLSFVRVPTGKPSVRVTRHSGAPAQPSGPTAVARRAKRG